uniref:Uncharacterized protein n=1 Tax=Arundo donax TaxID=35708 RepID=A0A0A8ZKN8_ARUDO
MMVMVRTEISTF